MRDLGIWLLIFNVHTEDQRADRDRKHQAVIKNYCESGAGFPPFRRPALLIPQLCFHLCLLSFPCPFHSCLLLSFPPGPLVFSPFQWLHICFPPYSDCHYSRQPTLAITHLALVLFPQVKHLPTFQEAPYFSFLFLSSPFCFSGIFSLTSFLLLSLTTPPSLSSLFPILS